MQDFNDSDDITKNYVDEILKWLPLSQDILVRVEAIKLIIPSAARYEQMAEECTELAQALLKMARKLRKENFTPKTYYEIKKSIIEEWTDVNICALTLDLETDSVVMIKKLDRWIERNSSSLSEETNNETD